MKSVLIGGQVIMYPMLAKSYKGVYPFKLGTTSYIYPDRMLPNVKRLAPYLDEIELLLLEGACRESLPSREEVRELFSLAKKHDITYNVHLPTDISLSARDPFARRRAVEALQRAIDLTSDLCPSTYTLHLSYEEDSYEKEKVEKWQAYVYQSLKQLLSAGIKGPAFSVETLFYPFEWVQEVLIDFNLSVCLDLGHLIAQKIEPTALFEQYSGIATIIHLHGVENRQDHVSLDRLSKKETDSVMGILERYTGVVSIEVFSYDHLKTSLAFLEKCWRQKDAS